MNRRKALQNLAAVTATLMYVPSCTVEEQIPTFSNLPISKEEYQLVRALTRAILPNTTRNEDNTASAPPITTPDNAEHFVLTMVNDCHTPLEIKRYLRGLRLFMQHVQDEHGHPFERLNDYQHVLLFTEMAASASFPKSLQFFLSKTKQLTVRHFTSSEYFLTEKLDWEFIPGRYIGCRPA